jgi:hypothetical protein
VFSYLLNEHASDYTSIDEQAADDLHTLTLAIASQLGNPRAECEDAHAVMSAVSFEPGRDRDDLARGARLFYRAEESADSDFVHARTAHSCGKSTLPFSFIFSVLIHSPYKKATLLADFRPAIGADGVRFVRLKATKRPFCSHQKIDAAAANPLLSGNSIPHVAVNDHDREIRSSILRSWSISFLRWLLSLDAIASGTFRISAHKPGRALFCFFIARPALGRT